MSDRLTPKFLTPEVIGGAADIVMSGVFYNSRLDGVIKKKRMGHLVVLVPSIEDARGPNYANWPNYPITPHCIFEQSYGDRREWTSEYDIIARCKAQQLWRGQNTDGNTDIMPHLLFLDDTRYWGGVKRHGLVVAFSGVQSYIDQMISGMVADALKALGRHMYEIGDDVAEKRAFLE